MKIEFMAALIAVATIVAVSTPSDARPRHYKHPTQKHYRIAQSPKAVPLGPQIDIAALPAYSTEKTTVAPRQTFPMGRKHIAPPASPSVASGSGIVRSAKTGATAHVSAKYSGQFQSYINDLEAQGASVRFMGGYRKGPCANYSLHPCGMALDVCQLSRGRVDHRCNLPPRKSIISIASRHGLTEGGIWCHSDYGHAQVGMTAGPCGSNLYAAVGEFQARARHRKMRLAHR